MKDRYPRGRWERDRERWPPGPSDDAWNQSGQVPYWDNPASRLPHFSYRRPQRPRAIQIAVVLMYVAAGLDGLFLILYLIASRGLGIFFASGSIFGIVLWLCMAKWAVESWGRFTVTMYVAIGTLGGAWLWWSVSGAFGAHRHLVSGSGGLLSRAVQLVLSPLGVSLGEWVLQLTIVVLLWRKESSAYYASMAAGG
jgi:hypothetical protein